MSTEPREMPELRFPEYHVWLIRNNPAENNAPQPLPSNSQKSNRSTDNWRPIIICCELTSEANQISTASKRLISKKNALKAEKTINKSSDAIKESNPDILSRHDSQRTTEAKNESDTTTPKDETSINALEKDFTKTPGSNIDNTKDFKEKLTNIISHIEEASQEILDGHQLQYITSSTNNPHYGISRENNLEIIPLYRVHKSSHEWIIMGSTPDAGGDTLSHWNINFSNEQKKTIPSTPSFATDRALLNRLYLLASISAARMEIAKELKQIFPQQATSTQDKTAAGRTSPASRGITLPLPHIFGTSTLCALFFSLLWVWNQIPGMELLNHFEGIILPGLTISTTIAITAFVAATILYTAKSKEATQIEEIAAISTNIRSSISQTNLKVASDYFHLNHNGKPYTAPSPPAEGLFRRIDEILQIKLAVESLDKVISVQKTNVESNYDTKQNQRLQVYRSIAAAGSGVFSGFFTYQVGDAILKFKKTADFTDDRSLQYWQFRNSKAAEELYNAAKTKQSSEEAPVGTLPPLNTNVSTALSSTDMDTTYKQAFIQNELLSQAWLLTATIVAVWLAGFVAWKKHRDQ